MSSLTSCPNLWDHLSTLRHPREGGDPVLTLNRKELDSRLRGNDGEECNNDEKEYRNNQGDSQ